MSKIEWTHRPGTKSEVWNPTTGCDKISQGCKFCYAEVMHKRLRGMGKKKYQHKFLGELQMHEEELLKPLSWKKPRTVFVNSMSDLFHKDVTWMFLDKVFAIMVLTPHNTYQILTKRADVMAHYFAQGKDRLVERWEQATYEIGLTGLTDKNDDPDAPACHVFNLCEQQWPRPNIWLGVSAENQETLDERVPFLVKVDAHVRFISYEPALGPIDCVKYFWYPDPHGAPADFLRTNQISWLIAGGESGQKARPFHPKWFTDIRDQCKAADIKFFFKQYGKWGTRWVNTRTDHPVFKMYDSYLRWTQKDWVKKGDILVDMNGKICHIGKDMQEAKYPVVILQNLGKGESGNVLDGVQHLEYPE